MLRARPKRMVTAVRPYGPRIRERVFALLSAAGFEVDEARVIPAGTSDAEAVEVARRAGHRILLVPFHAHRDSAGTAVNGLDFLLALAGSAGTDFPFRVFMPVSQTGMAAVVTARDSGRIPEVIDRALLVLPEESLDSPDNLRRLQEHLGSLGSLG